MPQIQLENNPWYCNFKILVPILMVHIVYILRRKFQIYNCRILITYSFKIQLPQYNWYTPDTDPIYAYILQYQAFFEKMRIAPTPLHTSVFF